MSTILEQELTTIQQLLVDGNKTLLKEKASQLRTSSHEETLNYLLNAIDNNRLEDSMTMVKDLLRQKQELVTFYDPKIGALKVELNYQEEELSKIQGEQDDLSKEVDLFHSRYITEVGHLMERVLYLRLQKLRIQAKDNPTLQSMLEAAEKEFEEFNSYRESCKDGVIYDLSDNKLRIITRLYRKASLICHPDKVKEEHKAKAQEIFSKITIAYKCNDFVKVKSIANYLEKTGGFDLKIDSYDNVEFIKNKIEGVIILQEEARDEIELIQKSNAYRTVASIEGSLDNYFNLIKENYKNQLSELESWMNQNS